MTEPQAPGTAAVATAAPAAAVVTTATASGIRRLNPEDGLFLRAEHLDQMQAYARDLAFAGGISGGTGVAYGYGLTLDGSDLHVTPGLAIDPGGVPLKMSEPATISLDPLSTPPGRFWIVEVMAGPDQPAGSEPVYGNLCGDPCSVASIQPWLDSSVLVQVTANDTLPGLAAVSPPARLRNWLASAFFDQERRNGMPWLTPGQSGHIAAINDLPWSGAQPAVAPSPAGVPLGALLRSGDTWVLDVWIARRDLIAAPSRDAWEWRLGLRPWAVFVAQVLQFQAQLADIPGLAPPGEAVVGDAEEFYEVVRKDFPRSRKAMEQIWDEWQRAHRQPVSGGALLDYGFGELPPGGFVLAPAGEGDLGPRIQAFFGSNVVVRLERNSADAALRAVAGAQHLDRIPLDQPDNRPVVDVWIPDVSADLPATHTDSYGWIAFTRSRHAAMVARAADQVSVFVVPSTGRESLEQLAARLEKEGWKLGQPVATLEYPAAEWGVPAPEVALEAVRDKLAEYGSDDLMGLIALARSDSRRPLAAVRAVLLPTGLAAGSQPQLLPTFIAQRAGAEAIVLVISPAQDSSGPVQPSVS